MKLNQIGTDLKLGRGKQWLADEGWLKEVEKDKNRVATPVVSVNGHQGIKCIEINLQVCSSGMQTQPTMEASNGFAGCSQLAQNAVEGW